MKKIFCVMLFIVMTAGVSFAGHHEGRYVREEAGRRNMKLITQDEAKSIAAKRIGRDEYDVKIDAVTGEIIKFKLDD